MTYLNGYLGGSATALQTDGAERHRAATGAGTVYLSQPPFLSWFGSDSIDVTKIEALERTDGRETICWHTLKSENQSAIADDGVIAIMRRPDNMLRVDRGAPVARGPICASFHGDAAVRRGADVAGAQTATRPFSETRSRISKRFTKDATRWSAAFRRRRGVAEVAWLEQFVARNLAWLAGAARPMLESIQRGEATRIVSPGGRAYQEEIDKNGFRHFPPRRMCGRENRRDGGKRVCRCGAVRTLLVAGDEVVALIGPSGRLNGLAGVDVGTRQGDILDESSSYRALRGGEGVVFHTAAVYDFHDRAEEMKAIATAQASKTSCPVRRGRGCGGLCSLHRRRFLRAIAPDPEVLAEDQPGTLDRSDLPRYVSVKAEQEERAIGLAEELGLELLIAAPTVVVGPYDCRPGPSNGLILNYLASPVKHSYRGGINIVSVRDVARGHRLVAVSGTPSERYVLGGQNVDYDSFYTMIAEMTGLPKPRFQAGRADSAAMTSVLATVGVEGWFSPFAAREQLMLIEKYFWYTHHKAAQLGYAAAPAQVAIADALGWLVMTSHVTREVRRSLRPRGSGAPGTGRRDTGIQESVMSIKFRTLTVVKHQVEAVWTAMRDQMPALSVSLDEIEEIRETSRDTTDGSVVRVVNEWQARLKLPGGARQAGLGGYAELDRPRRVGFVTLDVPLAHGASRLSRRARLAGRDTVRVDSGRVGDTDRVFRGHHRRARYDSVESGDRGAGIQQTIAALIRRNFQMLCRQLKAHLSSA